MEYNILASSSKGNSTIIYPSDRSELVILDYGLSTKKFKELLYTGFTEKGGDALLNGPSTLACTHIHSDIRTL